MSVDWSEAHTHCWRCGCEKNLQRCHIVPDSLGGKDEPGNIVLLCERCHKEGPNVSDPQIMWDWIRAYSVPFYETFWSIMGEKEYKFIYHKSFFEELKEVFEEAKMPYPEGDEWKELLKKHMAMAHEGASNHFGQYYFNNATKAGIYRMALKSMAAELGVRFPIGKACDENAKPSPWWSGV